MSEATVADAPPDRGRTVSGTGMSRYSFRENEAKWQQVWRERLDDLLEQRILGIDRQRDLARATANAPAERACRSGLDIARRRRKEDEADEIRPRIERHVERLVRFQPADFDRQTHAGLYALRIN